MDHAPISLVWFEASTAIFTAIAAVAATSAVVITVR